ncbi:transglycosylase domain-containing protein [Erysipelothrix sp. HDW6C]|uniref:biosynthetic peptidoglycan transglycosylase n=1 Tax=Erysipelothrix sp. HDW6C TaxID=2714930 RepID=UPI00140929F1|nr:biosynthetic peptidoglycan transglycosylase [Erysipelothrix sp. HDW6C]QIK69999.1 transglycosylase domain-containing protein [Erysipelothrix sp. HDW6C]
MKKYIKRGIIALIAIIVLVCGIIVFRGHQQYLAVINDKSLSDTVDAVENKQEFVHLDAMNPLFISATINTEDSRFYTRKAILDFEALGRATLQNLRAKSLVEGASTIPQQVAKNLYFEETTTFTRKVAEYFVTRDLLQNYSKDEILELYLNMNYYGDGFYGIYDASYGYFKVHPKDLNDGQATLLAGLPQAPSYYALSTNFEGARERQKHVLSRMVDEGIITQQQADDIFAINVYGG